MSPPAAVITATNVHAVRYHGPCGEWAPEPVPLCWHPRRPLLATGSTRDPRRLWDVTVWTPDGALHATMAGTAPLQDFGWSWNGRFLATATTAVTVWNATGQALRTLPGQWLAWSPTSDRLVVALPTHSRWQLWNLAAGTTRPLHDPRISFEYRRPVSWSPNGTCLMVCCALPDGTFPVTLWDQDGAVLARTTIRRPQAAPVLGCMWHPDNHHILMRTREEILLVDAQGQLVQVFPVSAYEAEWYTSTPCQWSPDGTLVAVATKREIQWWTATGTPVITRPVDGQALTLAWNPRGDVLATAAWSNHIQFWTRTGHLLRTLPIHNPDLGGPSMLVPFALAWDSAGQYLAAAMRGCTVHLWAL